MTCHFNKFFTSFLTILIQFNRCVLKSSSSKNIALRLCLQLHFCLCLFKERIIFFLNLSFFLNYGVFLPFYSNNFVSILPYTFSDIIAWNISRQAYWCYFILLLVLDIGSLIHFNFSTWLSNKLLLWNYFRWSLPLEYLFSL